MDFLFGFEDRKRIKEYEQIISKIEAYSKGLKTLSDDELKVVLKEKTKEFKDRLKKGESLDDILPEAFAVAREASRIYIGIEQYPVQLMGAIALHRGDVAEMKTGEGKTYTAPLAAYLNALTGTSVHIATSNDTLASRDGALVTPMFEGLGLTVGVVTEERDDDYKTDIEKRKKAYSCDITYGSSNAFAFDYLRDNTTHDASRIVRGNKEIGFIIIDEADQILVNDAIMPFKLSGTIKRGNESNIERIKRRRQEEELEKVQMRLYSDANAFVYKLFRDKEHSKGFTTEEEMALYMGGNSEATMRANRRYSVLYTPSSTATLTERGWLEAFKYFEGPKIDKIINDNSSLIIGNPSFEKGKDYLLEEGELSLTLRGLARAAKEIKEIRDLNNQFYGSSEFSGLSKAIDNALKAYFVLEKGKEYILDDTRTSTKGISKKKVLLVSNGRTAEGRVYSEGLQQAIELKERKLNSKNKFEIELTEEHEELASISQKAFYSIYPKISGMTGTSAKDLFENVYGMNTISIPKNSEYGVAEAEIDEIYRGRKDNDTVLFETDKEKIEAVIASVLESRKTGQPVLIGTTSVNESNLLYEEFRKRGIPCEKLNAEISDIEKENEIISRAGIRGSVTISTQMAGRGTDIKLGGSLDDMILQVKKEKIDIMIKNVIANMDNVSEQELRNMRIGANKFIEDKKMDDIVSEAKERLAKEQQEMAQAGGLKVIGYGHFSTKRDDDQLRGRAARQADPGVTEFYCSVRDLKENLGVPNERIKYLRKKGLEKGSPISGPEVEKVIFNAQSNVEGLITSVIANTQESDHYLSIMRKKVYSQRMRMLNGESPKENMEFIIDSSVVNLIDKNLPEYSRDVSPRKTLKKSGLDIENFIIDVEETFGIDLTRAFEEGKFSRLGEVQEYVAVMARKRYQQIRNSNGDVKQDEIDRVSIIGALDDAWLDFNGNLQFIKEQHRLSSMVQNTTYDEIFAMKKGFNETMIDAKLQIIGKMLGRHSTKERKENKEEDFIEIDESFNDYQVEGPKKNTPVGLKVRPRNLIAVISNGIKIIKEKIKYQFELVPYNEQEGTIERVNNDKLPTNDEVVSRKSK